MLNTPKGSARPTPPRSTYLSLSPLSPRWPRAEEQTLPSFQACAGPNVLAILAARMLSGFGRPRSGDACSLMLDFSVELGADQNHDYRQPHPGHKTDDGAE